jgi:hypothetical protein
MPANIVEGWAKRSSPSELKRYLQVAIGSCDECKLWLEMSKDEGYLSPERFQELVHRFNLVGAMLKACGSTGKASQNKNPGAVRAGFEFSLLRYIFSSLLRFSQESSRRFL